LKPIELPLKKLTNPPELQCVGFNLTDIDLKIKKGFIQLDADYQKIENVDSEFCKEFEKSLREGPMKALQSMGKDFPGFPGGFGQVAASEGDASTEPNQQGSEVPVKGPTRTKEENEPHTDEL
jgi:hypothetical protein